MKTFDLFYPVKGGVNQPFGINGEYYRSNGIPIDGHNGIDFFAPHGTKIYASHSGIAEISKDSKEGWGVTIRTKDTYEYKGQQVYFKTIYWHMIHDFPIQDGQEVKVGDWIGYADNTGFSTGSHLHFGLKPIVPTKTPDAVSLRDPFDLSTWRNIEQSNGYLGSIDPQPFFNGFYAEDAQEVIETQQKIVVSLLQQIINAVKTIWKK